MLGARIELQRSLGDWLTRSLAPAAEPHRAIAVVELDLRGRVRESRERSEALAPQVRVTSRNKSKLPGLGLVDGGATGTAMPEIDVTGAGRTTERISREVETLAARVTVHVYVDAAMAPDQRDALARLASELAGLEPALGDAVEVREMRAPAAAPPPAPSAASAATAPSPLAPIWRLAIACATALAAALILSVGLARRGSGASSGAPGRAGAGADRAVTPASEAASPDAGAVARPAVAAAELAAVADATPEELVEVLTSVDVETAAAVLDLGGVKPDVAADVIARLDPERRAALALRLGERHVVTRELLAWMQGEIAAALERARSRVATGGAERLTEILAAAPAAIRDQLLEEVASRDAELARAARAGLVLFEDLPLLAPAVVRQVVTAADAADVGCALSGAPEAVREAVLGAVSKRLRGILEVEEEAAQRRPLEDVAAARRALEKVMRGLDVRLPGPTHALERLAS